MVLKRLSNAVLIFSCFRSLQTYMVLKRIKTALRDDDCFRSLQTYMVLKPLLNDPYDSGLF